MSFSKKSVTSYSKSLFQALKKYQIEFSNEENYDIGNITSSELNRQSPNIFFIGEELLLIRSVIVSSKFINQYFKNPTYSEQEKLEVLFTIFPGLTLCTNSFLKVLAERSHLSLLPEISDEYTKLVVSFRNSTEVKITTASGLKENYGILLLNTLRKITKSKEIFLRTFHYPKILGGLIVEYNSKSIDASILKEFSLFVSEG
jgi:ATP synthase F1 delta subunit